ncbi:MAG: sglT 19, partial [Pedosphaera sp.]|nr:sglT 19 [Pedosphaera sp.]
MHANTHSLLQGCIIGVYLILMLIVGIVFKRFNKDTSDYFRGGCRATWWLVGVSAFMAGFSAWTFTGAAGAIFLHGWSILIIYLGNAFGFLLNFLFFGPWARQLRTVTSPEAIQLRFDEPTRAFYAFVGVFLSLLYSGLQLYGLALFSSSVFGLPLQALIITLGAVVVLYATLGGSWAVMATDFLQGTILIPITVLLAVLCLLKVGGIAAFFDQIQAQGLQADFALVKDAQHAVAGSFTLGWISAMFFQAALSFNTLSSASRYFSVKDGKAARKAALLGGALFLFGSLFWFIPPITARLLFADAVNGMPYPKPEETAYAVASFTLLPPGLVGVMVVAIFSATMSAMGPGLNGSAGVMVYDLYPLFCRFVGKTPRDVSRLMTASRVATVFLGTAVVGVALYFARSKGVGLFEAMINIGAMLAVPLSIPMVWCLFLRRSPSWA